MKRKMLTRERLRESANVNADPVDDLEMRKELEKQVDVV